MRSRHSFLRAALFSLCLALGLPGALSAGDEPAAAPSAGNVQLTIGGELEGKAVETKKITISSDGTARLTYEAAGGVVWKVAITPTKLTESSVVLDFALERTEGQGRPVTSSPKVSVLKGKAAEIRMADSSGPRIQLEVRADW